MVAAGFGGWWRDSCDRSFFLCHVSVDVGVGCGDLFVSEPEGDNGDVDSGVEESHRGGVSKGVGGDVFGPD